MTHGTLNNTNIEWHRMQCIHTNRRYHNVNFNMWTILSFDRQSPQKTSPYWLSTQRMRLNYYNYGHLLSASSLGDEPYALHSNDYIALFSASERTHCDLVVSVWPNACLPSTAHVWIPVQFHVAFLRSELRSCVEVEVDVLGSRPW